MKIGTIIDNYDASVQGRCMVRIDGLDTEKINGQYVRLDDDCHALMPAPTTSSTGGTSTPQIGDRVYVSDDCKYYYGRVQNKGSVKRLIHDNAENSDKVTVLASNSYNLEGNQYEFNIKYIPDEGLKIEADGHTIIMGYNSSKDENGIKGYSIDIKAKSGAEIELADNGAINIVSAKEVNLKCDKINLGTDASEKLILGKKLMEKFNSHTHHAPFGKTDTPFPKIEVGDFSDDIKIQ